MKRCSFKSALSEEDKYFMYPPSSVTDSSTNGSLYISDSKSTDFNNLAAKKEKSLFKTSLCFFPFKQKKIGLVNNNTQNTVVDNKSFTLKKKKKKIEENLSSKHFTLISSSDFAAFLSTSNTQELIEKCSTEADQDKDYTSETASKITWEPNSISKTFPPIIFISGGGVRYFWKAGYITYLMYHFDLSHCVFLGTSAGALVSTLACCNVDVAWASRIAIEKALTAMVWKKMMFLAGVVTELVKTWLNAVLPEVLDMTNLRSRLVLTAYRLSKFRLEGLVNFKDREDLINCLLASIHIPFYANGRGLRKVRASRYIDGGCGPDLLEIFGKQFQRDQYIIVRCSEDEEEKRKVARREYIRKLPPEELIGLMHKGFAHARLLHEKGRFKLLAPYEKHSPGTFDSIPNEDST